MPKLIVLTNMAAPYRNSFFKGLAEDWELLVVYNVWSEKDRTWHVDQDLAFPYKVLGRKPRRISHQRGDLDFSEERWLHGGGGVYKCLKEFQPDVIVSLEFGMRTLETLRYGLLHKVPVFVWWEGTFHTEKMISSLRIIVRHAMAKLLTGGLVNGVESRDYLIDLGVKRSRILEGATGTDTRSFSKKVDENLPQRDSRRSELGLTGLVFLFSGALSPRKGVKQLVDALRRLNDQEKQSCSILFVGEGPERAVIERFSSEPGAPKIHITGFVQPPELPGYYALGDWFVLPTLDDNWPLVTIEAVAAGLPQIFSKYNGGSVDVSSQSEYGIMSDPLDPSQLRDCLREAISIGPRRLPEDLRKAKADYYSGEAQAERATEFLRSFVRER